MSGGSVGTPGGPPNDPNTSALNDSIVHRQDGSTFHMNNNYDNEEKKLYIANNIANSILRSFGREFNMNMDNYMQS